MKYYVFALAGSLAVGQTATSTYTTDINGNRVTAATVVGLDHDDTHQVTEVTQSINGRSIPLQQTETHVVSKDANGSVVETLVRKYDPNGQLASTERMVTQTQTRPGGSTIHATTYRSDLNGRMVEAERQTVDSDTQGAVTTTQTVKERPSLSGSFTAVEKRMLVSEAAKDQIHQDETVYRRPDSSSDFAPAVREIKDVTHVGNVTTEKTAHYEPVATTSEMRLIQQSQATTTKNADGSESSQVNLYGSSWTGNVGDNQTALPLREQDVIERQKGPGGSVVETLSVRRPTPADPNRLGALQKISETVCKGNCSPDEKK